MKFHHHSLSGRFSALYKILFTEIVLNTLAKCFIFDMNEIINSV